MRRDSTSTPTRPRGRRSAVPGMPAPLGVRWRSCTAPPPASTPPPEPPDAAVATIIDFGLANRTNAVYDLATAIERNCIEWLDLERPFEQVVHLVHVHALLDGYESVVPLTEPEGRALAAMLAIVHVEFALSEADFFLRVLGSQAKADLAYEDFLLGHLHWFAGAAGQRLLSALDRRLTRSREVGACVPA